MRRAVRSSEACSARPQPGKGLQTSALPCQSLCFLGCRVLSVLEAQAQLGTRGCMGKREVRQEAAPTSTVWEGLALYIKKTSQKVALLVSLSPNWPPKRLPKETLETKKL